MIKPTTIHLDDLNLSEFGPTDWYASIMDTNRDLEALHPLIIGRVLGLALQLTSEHEAGTLQHRWSLYEGWRYPWLQDDLFRHGKSRVPAWQSPHQYGLAVDYAVFSEGGRQKRLPLTAYRELHEIARVHDLIAPDTLHPGHLEAPEWAALKPHITALIAEETAH